MDLGRGFILERQHYRRGLVPRTAVERAKLNLRHSEKFLELIKSPALLTGAQLAPRLCYGIIYASRHLSQPFGLRQHIVLNVSLSTSSALVGQETLWLLRIKRSQSEQSSNYQRSM